MPRGTSGDLGAGNDGGLPNITGNLDSVAMMPYNGNGAFNIGTSAGTVPGPNSGSVQRRLVSLDASRSSSIYGNSTIVVPAGPDTRYIIKY